MRGHNSTYFNICMECVVVNLYKVYTELRKMHKCVEITFKHLSTSIRGCAGYTQNHNK